MGANYFYPLTKIAAKGFSTFPEFCSHWGKNYKTTFGIFDILKIEILTLFFFSFSLTCHWDPMGAKISKLKTTFGIFDILKIEILTLFFFSFSLTCHWDPMGAKISKRYYSYKSEPKFFKLFLNFPPNGPHKMALGIFKILSFRILTIFFRTFQIQHECTLWRSQKTSIIWKTSYRRANGVKFRTSG